MKFTEECLTCTEKHALVKKMFTSRLNMGLTLSGKENHMGAGIKNKSHAESL